MANLLGQVDRFWKDIETSEYLFKINIFLIFLGLFFALGVHTAVPGENKAAFTFFALAVVALIVAGFEHIKPNSRVFNFYGLGKNPLMAVAGVAVGGLMAFVALGQQFFSILPVPFSVAAPTFSFAWIWVVVFSPVLEAFFFRGTAFPMFKIALNNPYLAAFLTSVGFAGYHYLAYGASIANMQAAFVFSLVMIVGCQLFQSLGFELGYHGINNYLTFG